MSFSQKIAVLAFGLPTNTTSGIKFHVSTKFLRVTHNAGEIKSVRNLVYATNGKVIKNQILPNDHGYNIEFIVQAHDDCVITLNINNNADLSHQMQPGP